MSNTTPNYTKNGVISTVRVTAANTSSDGGGTVGTDIYLVATGDATSGTFVEFVRWAPRASAAGTAMTATVGRMFISSVNSGSTNNATTHLFAEVTLPAITADSTSAAVNTIDVPFNIRLPANYTILATIHATAAANTAWGVMAVGGDY